MRSLGRSAPLGATLVDGGINFSLFSRTATGVQLLFFDREEDAVPSRVLRIDPVTNHSYHYWHVLVPEVRPGQLYGYRVEGPSAPERGLRFDPTKVLLDPYARAVVVPKGYDREAARRKGDNAATAMKSAVVDSQAYNWEGDVPLNRPSSQTIIYEMHVRGFTRHPSSGVGEKTRGTYAGLIEKIPYLQELGITAVELLPIYQYDAQDCPPGKVNYWGYAPVSFFAPHQAYSSRQGPLGPADEFRDMVKALHRAGIEVILDVVFNHTAEGDHTGPTLGFRAIDNPTYYILEEGGARYANYTGCGNTLNANHPVVRRMIVDSLRYWVEEMHVDGFRFDLASILSRDAAGQPLPNPPVLWDIESDPTLAGTKLIAEAWDAAGLYQVGSFVGDAWKEWNGRFRDDVRDFFRAAPGSLRRVADRIVGSPEVYGHKGREAEQSVNFVTCHDGFTLNDLVSYNHKHNEPNGEDNRDGANDNRSWNCGVEGPTDDPAVEKLRNRQVKNYLTVTLLSLGVPMILMGDEVRHTQGGNNNAYCQDNEISWLDWTRATRHADLQRFVQLLIARRVLRDAEHERISLTTLLQEANKAWHGVKLHQPDWSDSSHSVALSAELRSEGLFFHLILNGYWEPLDFELPEVQGGTWRRWIDTSLDSPDDIVPWEKAPSVEGRTYRVAGRSVVMLWTGSMGNASTRRIAMNADKAQSISTGTVSLADEDAVKQILVSTVFGLWDIVNNLTRLRPSKRERYRVTIFGSARAKPGTYVYDEVKRVATALAEMGCDIITGGGPGLMQAANEGATAANAPERNRSVGIRVDLPFEQEANPFVEQAFEHKTFFTRLHHFVLTSDAFVVVPGGIGTVLELMMIWQLLQVRHVQGAPLILIGKMWAELVEWARAHLLTPQLPLANPEDLKIPQCVGTADEAIALLREHHQKWQRDQTS